MTITQGETATILCVGPFDGPRPSALEAAIQSAIQAQRGTLIEHADAVVARFNEPESALAALLSIAADGEPLSVASALASGPGRAEALDAIRQQALYLLDAAHPGQMVLTEAAWHLLRDELPAGVELRELEARRLKDLMRAEPLFELRHPAASADFPPLKTIDSFPNNLPVQQMPLIGRREEIAELRTLIRQADIRLITLRGTSGTGKTRLSLQVAAEEIEAFSDGIFFVGLAPVSDPTLVPSAIAQVLGVKERGGQPLVDALVSHLANKHTLLLLDNFEQVVAAGEVISALIAGTRHLKLMITSQIELALPEEHVFVLPPMTLPELNNLPPLAEIGAYPAIRLFVERTRAVRPAFQLTNANASAVVELCTRLMGLPLAIELATAHSGVFSPEDMLMLLRSRLALVKTSVKLSSRAQVLRHVLDWSYNLLGPGEQALFARLGTFVGGCTLEAVEAVCNAEADLHLDALDAVNVLLNKHLLLQEELAEGELRYIMLDAVHEFAGKRLSERRESIKSRHQHANYFIQLAEDAEPALRGAEQVFWLTRLESEHHNLRAALRWTLENPDPERAVCLSAALSRFWLVHGHLSEGRRWLEAVLVKPSSATPELRVKALAGLANLMNVQGDYDQARERYEESLAIARANNDIKAQGSVLANIGIVRYYQGELAEAQDYYEQSLRIWRQLDEPWSIASTLNNLGDVASELGDPERSRVLYTESLAVLRGLGEKRSIGIVLLNLGVLDYEAANYASASERLAESLALFRELGDRRFTAAALLHAGQVAAAGQDQATARQLLGEALTMQLELGDRRGVITSLEALADVLAASQPAYAARLLGSAAAQRSVIGAPLSVTERVQYDQTVAGLRQALGEPGFAAAHAAGEAEAPEQALAQQPATSD